MSILMANKVYTVQILLITCSLVGVKIRTIITVNMKFK